MLKNLLHRPIAVTMILIAIVAIGILSLTYIPVSLMPQIDIPKITVQCVKTGASVTEIEQQMIAPLRSQLSQVAGLKDIESQSRIDAGTITMTFEPGADMDILFIEVNEKIDRAMNGLPKDIDRPKIIKASAMDIPAFYVDVFYKDKTSKNSDKKIESRDEQFETERQDANNMELAQLSKLVRNVISKRIEQLSEVAMVDISGTVGSEIQCIPDVEKLEAMGMSIHDIENAIKENNIVLGALNVVSGIYRYTIHFDAQILNKEDIENIYFRHQGRMMQLKDVCQVIEKPAVRNGVVRHDDFDAISVAVIKQNDAQMEDLQNGMKTLLESMKTDYPDVDFSITRDQTQLLTYSIDNLEWNLILAAVLACAILFLFNRSWRTPLLIVISIPLSLILTLLCFYVLGISLNIISLSGLILGVGMIVDNAIIVIDNMKDYVHKEDNIRFDDFIVKRVKEVFFPMLSSVLTTCSVFLPLIFISGTAGALFYDQAMGVTIALFASLVVASWVVPVYYYALFKKKSQKENVKCRNRRLRFKWLSSRLKACKRYASSLVLLFSFQPRLHSSLETWHSKCEKWTLRHGRLCIGMFAGALMLIAVVFQFIKKEKMPEVAHDDVLVNVDWNAGISVDENMRRVAEILDVVKSHVVTSTSMVGAQEFILSHTKDITSSEAVLYLKGYSEDGIDSLKEEMDAYVTKHYPQAKVEYEISGNIFDLIFQTDKPALEIRLSHKDGGRPGVTEAGLYTDSLRRMFREVSFLTVPTENNLQYVANPENMAYHDVSYGQLSTRLSEMVGKSQVYEIASGAQSVPVVVGSDVKADAEDVLAGYVRNRNGVDVPISYLVDVTKVENFKRLYAGTEGEYYPVKIDDIDDDKAEEIMDRCEELSSLRSAFHGDYFDSREMIGELSMILLVAVMLLYFILAAQFESLVQPLIILSEVILDVSVVMFILWILGESLNIMSMIGIVVMSGIIINDSILKVDTINRELRMKNEERSMKNYALIKSIMIAGQRRLTPIVMTSLTTILALLPFLHKGDMGSALQYPLSLSLIIGMTVGTMVSLFFVPLVYFLIYRKKA
ncbi:MAG: efflux RND transporter permease subunit [Bacteroidaceae bacterium]|nr:efflux RND transporter permease subunit [Bacteroidaceae bacterium]